MAELIPRDGTVIDVGSGAGLPGIVLAILRPDARLTLLEPMARRVAFLLECVQILGLDNVTVLRGRAEELAGELTADVVTARAVAPLDRLAGLAAALVRPGGVVLAIKGQSAQAEVARAQPVLRRLGFRDVSVVTAGSGTVIPAVTVVRMVSRRPERLPSARRRVTGRAADRATGRAGAGEPPPVGGERREGTPAVRFATRAGTSWRHRDALAREDVVAFVTCGRAKLRKRRLPGALAAQRGTRRGARTRCAGRGAERARLRRASA